MGRDSQIVGVAAAIHLLLLLVWIVCVRGHWIREQAETYAERLFETMDRPHLARRFDLLVNRAAPPERSC